MARSGDPAAVVERFAPLAARAEASAYLLTIVARGLEETGHRREAIALLKRAAIPPPSAPQPLPAGTDLALLAERYRDDPSQAVKAVPYIRALLAVGETTTAAAAAQKLLIDNPGAPDAYLIKGDVELAQSSPTVALTFYRTAASIRFGESELLRLDQSLRASGRGHDADLLDFAFAVQNPQSLAAARLLANVRARGGEWNETAALLGWVGARSGWRDASLLTDLAFARLRQGRVDQARSLARRASDLQPASLSVRQVERLITSVKPPNSR